MNTAQLLKCVKQNELLHRYFTGVYACDTVPKTFSSLPACYIMNTDPIALPGRHWIAVYLSLYGPHEFFDSYGRQQSTVAPTIRGQGTTKWIENTIELQGPMSTTCGQYCLYYLSERCEGRMMTEILSDFSCTRDCMENDILINEYMNAMYNIELDIYDVNNFVMQICTARLK